MPSALIQWFPGHMAKTRRMVTEMLPQCDAVIQILDARIPESSRNPEIARLIGNKPMLTVLSKASLSDAAVNELFARNYRSRGEACLFLDCITGYHMRELPVALRTLLSEKLQRYEAKGMAGRTLKVMIVGIPNVGKSSLINRLAKGNRAKVEDRPGVTRDKQWIRTDLGFDLLDTPGVLWPKFDDQRVGELLAMTGAVKDEILDLERLAILLVGRLRKLYPQMLSERYKLGDLAQYETFDDYELALYIGRRRGFLLTGAEIDFTRTANMLLDEFRGGKIGKITLERPGATL